MGHSRFLRLSFGWDACAGALPLPLIVLPEESLVLFDLSAKLGERGLDASEDVSAISGSVQRARGQRKMHGENVALLARMLFDVRVELYQIGGVAFQELVQLGTLPRHFLFDGLAPF